jgi:hypothetical protein
VIEQAVVTYIKADPQITVLVGNRVYYHRAPTSDTDSKGNKVVMPWIVVTNSGGMPERLTRGDPLQPGMTETYGTTRDLDGYQGSFRYLVTAYVRYTFPTNFPETVV